MNAILPSEADVIATIQTAFRNHRDAITAVERDLSPQIALVASNLLSAFRSGKKLLVMGNGGSAADAQHFAAELVGRFRRERKGVPALALTTDSSIVTAVGNDYGFDAVFRRQVEALAVAGDVVFGISTSGNSANIMSALAAARSQGCVTMALLGREGGTIRALVDHELTVSAQETAHIQEAHITIIHILCDLVEQGLCADAGMGESAR